MIRFFWMVRRHDAESAGRRSDHKLFRPLRPSVTTRLLPKRKPHRKCCPNSWRGTPHRVSSRHRNERRLWRRSQLQLPLPLLLPRRRLRQRKLLLLLPSCRLYPNWSRFLPPRQQPPCQREQRQRRRRTCTRCTRLAPACSHPLVLLARTTTTTFHRKTAAARWPPN